MPEYWPSYIGQHVCNHIAEVKDEDGECEKERANGFLLYLEERFKKDDNKIKDLHKFSKEIHYVLNNLVDVFNTSLNKSINNPEPQLNLGEGYRITRGYLCRPTQLHYMETAEKLLADLLRQGIIEESGDTRTDWVLPAHFIEKPNRVPPS